MQLVTKTVPKNTASELLAAVFRPEILPFVYRSVLLLPFLVEPALAQPQDNRLSARIAALEAEVARLSSALEATNATPRNSALAAPTSLMALAPAQASGLAPGLAPGQAPAPAAAQITPNSAAVSLPSRPAAPSSDRFALAALNLQASLATGRPYQRELQALRDAAPSGGLPPALADTLVSHAARGLLTLAELREGFLAIAPNVIERAADHDGWLDWALALGRRLLANAGLVEPPPLPASQVTIANASRLLARGMVAAALADIETLDPALLPLLSGWLAQARARIAADQAMQETILRAINRPAPG